MLTQKKTLEIVMNPIFLQKLKLKFEEYTELAGLAVSAAYACILFQTMYGQIILQTF